jgi:hypothetical protein
MSYLDNDGLLRKYGTESAEPVAGGEYCTYGPLHEIEIKIDLTDLGSSSAIVDGVDNIFFPKNARIEEVEIVVHTAATSAGSATLDIGLVKASDRSTAIDADGLVAAMAKTALDAAGEKTVLRVGGTGAGALIGTTNSNIGHFVANYGTAAFTAGVIYVRVKYYAV